MPSDNGEEGMDCNDEYPHTGRQVTSADQPGLSMTGMSMYINLVSLYPRDGKLESQRLLDVGKEEIEDQEEELIAPLREMAGVVPAHELAA